MVLNGVRAGYRVIEEHVRQGQEAARTLWPGARSESDGPPLLGLTERMMRGASDLAGLFSEFLESLNPTSWAEAGRASVPPPGTHVPGDFGISTSAGTPGAAASQTSPVDAQESGGTTRLSLDIVCERRVEVKVDDLPPGAWAFDLEVHDLRAESRDHPRLKGIEARGISEEKRVVLTIRIARDLPAGTYKGLLVDRAANLPCGLIAVRLFEAVAPRGARPNAKKAIS